VNQGSLGGLPYTLLIDPATHPEFVSVIASTGSSVTATFTKTHSGTYTVASMSPYSYCITEYALDLLGYQQGLTMVEMSFYTSSFDIPIYAEALLVPVAVTSSPAPVMGTFKGNPVATDMFSPYPSPTAAATKFPVATTRDIKVGQTLNLFSSASDWETDSVVAVDPTGKEVTLNEIQKSHTHSPLILRGTQAFDGCQMIGTTAEPDASTSGGIGDFLISGTCGTDGVASNSHAGGVYCREFRAMSFYAEQAFNAAACVNLTDQNVSVNSLTSAGGCSGYCLTQTYGHVCGAINSSDDGCLFETSPVSVTLSNQVFPGNDRLVQVSSVTNIDVEGSYRVDQGLSPQETIVVTQIMGSQIRASFQNHHFAGADITAPSATIQLDSASHGGGGSFCGAKYANTFMFNYTSCPMLTVAHDTIPPMSGVILQ